MATITLLPDDVIDKVEARTARPSIVSTKQNQVKSDPASVSLTSPCSCDITAEHNPKFLNDFSTLGFFFFLNGYFRYGSQSSLHLGKKSFNSEIMLIFV